MTFDELALQLVLEMVKAAGPLAWTDPDARGKISDAAREFAAAIFGEEVISMTTNAVYVKKGTAIRFGSEATDTYAWTTENISSGAGRQAVLHDQGADGTARPLAWEYEIITQWAATPTVSAILDCRLKTKGGAGVASNDDGDGDIAVSSVNKLLNLVGLNSPVCDEAAANIPTRSTGIIQIPQRYFGPVLWNLGGSATKNDGPATYAIFTPLYEDIQSAA